MASTCVVQEQSRDANTITLQTLPPSERSRTESSETSHEGFAALEKWNEPRINAYRSFATFFSFLVMGANDAAYGVSETIRENTLKFETTYPRGIFAYVFANLVFAGFDPICNTKT
jgi:hypothetical protein